MQTRRPQAHQTPVWHLRKGCTLVWVTLLLVYGMTLSAGAQETHPDTQDIFGRFSDCVVKIEIVENGSGAKAIIGSGFFVSAQGHIVTNYHVISNLVHHPERYRAEYVDRSDLPKPLQVLAIDVVHDLAIVKSEERSGHSLKLQPIRIEQGVRLYSLGYPHDIGISIVEGTYNGFLEHSLYKKIHFTGSINPGMSGGPTITASGRVIGINVSTAGNQVSFLVPAKHAAKLLIEALNPESVPPENLLDLVNTQLLAHQESYLADNMMTSGTPVRLGHYQLPSKLAPFFNCWADASREQKEPYQVVDHQCSTEDYIFISGQQRSGSIRFHHRLITSDKLNRFRFFKLYSDYFSDNYDFIGGSEEEVTPYRCETETVEHADLTFKTVFCVRRYRKMDGLYDAIFKAAALGSKDTGLETTLILSGVSFEKAVRLSRSYLEAISWHE